MNVIETTFQKQEILSESSYFGDELPAGSCWEYIVYGLSNDGSNLYWQKSRKPDYHRVNADNLDKYRMFGCVKIEPGRTKHTFVQFWLYSRLKLFSFMHHSRHIYRGRTHADVPPFWWYRAYVELDTFLLRRHMYANEPGSLRVIKIEHFPLPKLLEALNVEIKTGRLSHFLNQQRMEMLGREYELARIQPVYVEGRFDVQ